MYELMLTKGERDAIDWIGHRYAHGDILKCTLLADTDVEWDDDGEITFLIPEVRAWEVQECVMEDNMACFSQSLRQKFLDFCGKIV